MVRPHLHFYPEDAGVFVKHAYQSSRWLNEMHNELLTPMARLEAGNFFIFEPCLLEDQRLVIPYRWYYHDGTMFARVWPMYANRINGAQGWIVYEFESFEVQASTFLVCFPFLCESYEYRGLLDPRIIHG